MSVSPSVDLTNVYKMYAGSAELSPFHSCYASDEIVLRLAVGRFYAHDNGEDHLAAYWRLRQHAAIYDVPERPVEIAGPDVVPFLEKIFARKVSDLKAGRGRYSIACTHNGCIFMDGILFKLAENRFWYVQPDGALETWLLAHQQGFDITVSDPHSRVLQIQGPKSQQIMQAASDGMIDRDMGYFHSGFFAIGGQEVYVSRTGWTGELGYEIYTQGEHTDCPRLWDHLMRAGAPHQMMFSGLQSMNIRRIEAGILDCGSDFDTSMTPVEAGLGKFIDLEKPDFIGREALLREQSGTRLFGVICPEMRLRSGFTILKGGIQIGYLTTGTYSPYLKAGIGYVRFDVAKDWIGQTLEVRCGDDQHFNCEIVALPFYDREKAIPRGIEIHPWPA